MKLSFNFNLELQLNLVLKHFSLPSLVICTTTNPGMKHASYTYRGVRAAREEYGGESTGWLTSRQPLRSVWKNAMPQNKNHIEMP